MQELTFDIFSGLPEEDVLWLESVEGLAKARARMEAIAAQKPGRYFIFSGHNHSVVAKVDNSPESQRSKAETA